MSDEMISISDRAVDIAERINEGVWQARAMQLARENAMLRARIKMLEAKLDLAYWGLEREHEIRLGAECALDRKKRALWRRALKAMGNNV